MPAHIIELNRQKALALLSRSLDDISDDELGIMLTRIAQYHHSPNIPHDHTFIVSSHPLKGD